MSGITGMGKVGNLPNYSGVLFGLTPEDTPFLSSIGGLTGGRETLSTQFNWSTYDLRDAADDRQRLEGADAPTAEERVRAEEWNYVEIHQEQVSLSYTKLAAVGQLAATSGLSPQAGVSNNVTDELDWQLAQALKQIARDVEVSFLNGTRTAEAGATPRQTQGLLGAITTNANTVVSATSVWSDVDEDDILDLMQDVWTSGGIMEGETRTVLVNAGAKRRLTEIFITGKNYQESSRNVGGVNLSTFETDFGRFNIMLDRHMPTNTLAVVSLEQCAPVFLNIPGKGHMFAEPLAKTGASEKVQIYGELGLFYGPQHHHGKLTLVTS